MRRKEDVMVWVGGAFGAALLGIGLLVADKAPVMDARSMREAFQALDTNKDSVVTREEFEFNKDTVIFRRASEPGAKLKFEDTRVSRATFDSFDLDGDGLITASDVREAPFFKFENFDKNKDRHIDFSEFQDFLNTLAK